MVKLQFVDINRHIPTINPWKDRLTHAWVHQHQHSPLSLFLRHQPTGRLQVRQRLVVLPHVRLRRGAGALRNHDVHLRPQRLEVLGGQGAEVRLHLLRLLAQGGLLCAGVAAHCVEESWGFLKLWNKRMRRIE